MFWFYVLPLKKPDELLLESINEEQLLKLLFLVLLCLFTLYLFGGAHI